jgi:hypothetical protein
VRGYPGRIIENAHQSTAGNNLIRTRLSKLKKAGGIAAYRQNTHLMKFAEN